MRIGHDAPECAVTMTEIRNYLRQQEEKDYLGEVQPAISTSFTKLARQVEKDRAEQQLLAGALDHLCDWLAFVLPSPPDRPAAEQLRSEQLYTGGFVAQIAGANVYAVYTGIAVSSPRMSDINRCRTWGQGCPKSTVAMESGCPEMT